MFFFLLLCCGLGLCLFFGFWVFFGWILLICFWFGVSFCFIFWVCWLIFFLFVVCFSNCWSVYFFIIVFWWSFLLCIVCRILFWIMLFGFVKLYFVIWSCKCIWYWVIDLLFFWNIFFNLLWVELGLIMGMKWLLSLVMILLYLFNGLVDDGVGMFLRDLISFCICLFL